MSTDAPAPSQPFAHLHCHSHYSLLDGANRIPAMIEKCKTHGMNSLAITDHGNLFGALEFYEKCRGGGINPIIGYEAYIAPGKRTDRSASRMKEASFHLTLLATNQVGFKNLVKMASKAYLEGFYYKPRIDKDLLEAHNEGIICLSGCASSELSHLLLTDQQEQAEQLLRWYEKHSAIASTWRFRIPASRSRRTAWSERLSWPTASAFRSSPRMTLTT